MGLACAQAVSSHPLTTETQVQLLDNPCGMRGEQSGSEMCLCPST